MGVLLHQSHDTVPYCQAWQVGFCGSLTTFSSWNMQMVTMLEQGDIAMAIVGYILGTFGAYGSFVLGTALLTHVRVSDVSNDENDDDNSTHRNSSDTNASRKQHTFPRGIWLIPPTLLACGLLLFSLTFTTTNSSTFISTLAPLIWAAPAGALTRYVLSIKYNTAETPMRGTLIANWTACILLAVVTGLEIEGIDMSPWATGFLGSLSTVSTWIKEIHCHDPPSNWLYAAISLGGAMLWSLVIYVPMHRLL
ncbi:hypothetical protein FisN_23Lh032 [Fistulifera solaris]|uniref:Fluoride ion transporter CrcB n=1 Tax=Fistulifera solaris TaxID=1519565 RepID=A0A1Z5KKQ6_FISSO|nr:hypothetical protein FisN_23Lh032 [Fistulifera solaris]|eukprot:GAX26508.1 hypothetical protein FisN_23Lh032 [Fistulifera solaris]